jgi:hydrogenase expression/formation protein HypE
MTKDDLKSLDGFACPVPLQRYEDVLLAHGGGGKLTQQLIHELFLPLFHNEFLAPLHDGAIIDISGIKLAFSTDSYVIQPMFFPGGDIGSLAVHGTVNDLAMCGARPLCLSAGFIVEEGCSMEELSRVVRSMQAAAKNAGVVIATGDTKVVDRGKGDKIFINTSGIGLVQPGVSIAPDGARPGDRILINGEIALHGIAVMSVREGLQFDSQILSDSAALNTLVASMLAAGKGIHVLRDPTRGGIASALNEIAQSANVGIHIDELKIPIGESVKGACEILGLDPLYVANEGKVLAFVSPEETDDVLCAMKQHPLGRGAAIIGTVVDEHPGFVTMRTSIGGTRIVDMISGEQLPRIC